METVYYTLTARGIVAEGELEQAVGGARRVLLVRNKKADAVRPAGNNVVDLAAWKARREAEQQGEDGEMAWESEEQQLWSEAPAERPRRERRSHTVLFTGELLATAAVIAVAAALLLKIAGLL